jgi:hypothetical protein
MFTFEQFFKTIPGHNCINEGIYNYCKSQAENDYDKILILGDMAAGKTTTLGILVTWEIYKLANDNHYFRQITGKVLLPEQPLAIYVSAYTFEVVCRMIGTNEKVFGNINKVGKSLTINHRIRLIHGGDNLYGVMLYGVEISPDTASHHEAKQKYVERMQSRYLNRFKIFETKDISEYNAVFQLPNRMDWHNNKPINRNPHIFATSVEDETITEIDYEVVDNMIDQAEKEIEEQFKCSCDNCRKKRGEIK